MTELTKITKMTKIWAGSLLLLGPDEESRSHLEKADKVDPENITNETMLSEIEKVSPQRDHAAEMEKVSHQQNHALRNWKGKSPLKRQTWSMRKITQMEPCSQKLKR